MARRMAGVGWVTVSERRSIRGIAGRIARGRRKGRRAGGLGAWTIGRLGASPAASC
jgi:hypothetical protein